MKNKENIYLDLSKLSGEEQKEVISMLPKVEFLEDYEIDNRNKYLRLFANYKWIVAHNTLNKTEITLPEFRELFESKEERETFTQRMEKEMKANEHKGDWRSFAVKENRIEILDEIRHHYDKLVLAFESDNEELIREHSADIGNIAMFMYESDNSNQ